MTCVAVVRGADGGLWMGADSCVVRGHIRTSLAGGDSKVFALPGNIGWIGTSGANSTGSPVRYGFSPPVRTESSDVLEWVFANLAPAMKARYLEAGAYSEDADPQADGWARGTRGECILVVEGQIFYIDQNVFPMHVAGDYFAIGCGDDLAIGALAALKYHRPEMPPKQMLECALSVAARHSDSVAPPFVIYPCTTTPPPT